jgi:nucleoid DNA-binding protein
LAFSKREAEIAALGETQKTNTQVEVGAKRVPFFRPGKEVRKLVRKKSDQDD